MSDVHILQLTVDLNDESISILSNKYHHQFKIDKYPITMSMLNDLSGRSIYVLYQYLTTMLEWLLKQDIPPMLYMTFISERDCGRSMYTWLNTFAQILTDIKYHYGDIEQLDISLKHRNIPRQHNVVVTVLPNEHFE